MERNEMLERIEKIARVCCNAETLETRNNDSLDFHEIAVWSLKDALQAAYEAGMEQARRNGRKGNYGAR